MFVIDDICVLVVGLIEIGQAAAAFVEPAIEVAAAYKAGEKGVKAAGKAIDWAKAEINLRRLKQKLEDLKNSRPGEHGHPECKSPSPAQARAYPIAECAGTVRPPASSQGPARPGTARGASICVAGQCTDSRRP